MSETDAPGRWPQWSAQPASRAEFAERLTQVGLEPYADALGALVRASLQLIPASTTSPLDAAAPEVAEAAPLRLGGRPVLPAGASWPRRADGAPLSLIAQLDLGVLAATLSDQDAQGTGADAASADAAGADAAGADAAGARAAAADAADAAVTFPATGSLAFFYDAIDQSVWGFDPGDRHGWAVLAVPEGSGTPRKFPADLPEQGRFAARALTAHAALTFPALGSYDVEAAVGEPWSEAYEQALGDDPGSVTHRFLGHPDPIQGDMQLECHLASNGVRTGDGDYLDLPETARLAPGAADWRLLLQVDSDESAGMSWGDVGRLYWWIRAADLAAGRWERCWLVLQCY